MSPQTAGIAYQPGGVSYSNLLMQTPVPLITEVITKHSSCSKRRSFASPLLSWLPSWWESNYVPSCTGEQAEHCLCTRFLHPASFQASPRSPWTSMQLPHCSLAHVHPLWLCPCGRDSAFTKYVASCGYRSWLELLGAWLQQLIQGGFPVSPSRAFFGTQWQRCDADYHSI